MAIPHVFSPVRPQDYTITPITVHKQYVIRRSDLYNGSTPITSSGYKILEARHTNEKLKLGTERTYPTNSFDGSNCHIMWNHINTLYYKFPIEDSNPRYIYKNLDISASIFQIPQHDFGEGLKPATVQLTSSIFGDLFYFGDDGNGNLYHQNTSVSNNPVTASNHVLCSWKCEDYNRISNFKYLTNNYSYRLVDNDKIINYTDVTAKTYPLQVDFKNVISLLNSSNVSGNITRYKAFYFPPDINTYIRTQHQNDLNLVGNFTILFSFRCASGLTDFIFIDKSKIKTKIENVNDFAVVDGIKYSNATSSSVVYDPVNVYPYRVEINGSGGVTFTRTNGISTKTLTSTSTVNNSDEYFNVAITKVSGIISLYINSILEAQVSDFDEHITNNRDVMFGCSDFTSLNLSQGTNDFDINGYHIGDIRFLNNGLSADDITALNSINGYNFTNVIGNVFYKTGKIVITSFQSNNLFDFDFTLKYRNTHTIYQYETLCRIKPGDFNLSQNPTTRQTPYSDLLINEMTSSVADGGMPVYATTVGLYNDSGELLVIGKLGQALKMREDVPINLIIRFDT